MKKDEIHLHDIERILFGNAPASFLLETLVRSIISFAILLFILRLLGKRMSGKLTSTEMAVQLMFGAIVSSAMQIPDRGILEGGFTLFLVLLFQRGITWWSNRQPKIEDKILGTMSLLIKDGVLQLDALDHEKISRNQLFGKLRTKNIKQLGEVERLYMESNGTFSLYKNKDKPAGLTVFPAKDEGAMDQLEPEKDMMVCFECGETHIKKDLPDRCPNCKSKNWKDALKGKN